MELDFEGLISLLITVTIVIVWFLFKKPKDIKKYFENLDTLSTLTTSAFVGIGIIALWLTTRVTGLHVKRYLTNNYNYNQYEIFAVVAYALATNLCFTLARTLRKKGEEGQKTVGVIEAAIQAVLVALIIFLPSYGDPSRDSLFQRIGVEGYVFILVAMATAALLLMLGRQRMLARKNEGR